MSLYNGIHGAYLEIHFDVPGAACMLHPETLVQDRDMDKGFLECIRYDPHKYPGTQMMRDYIPDMSSRHA